MRKVIFLLVLLGLSTLIGCGSTKTTSQSEADLEQLQKEAANTANEAEQTENNKNNQDMEKDMEKDKNKE